MPELVEVERARRWLHAQIHRCRIVDVGAVLDEIVMPGMTPELWKRSLIGKHIVDTKRRGKFLWLELDSPPHPIIHFGMTGSLRLIDPGSELPKFSKWWFRTSAEQQVVFVNMRRLGRVRLAEDPLLSSPICDMKFDALQDELSLSEWIVKLTQSSRAIKACLLDQSFTAGIGNWIADEVLYQAGIHPEQPANTLDSEQAEKLYRSIKYVITKALEFEHDEFYPKDWLVHYRWDKRNTKSVDCLGRKIHFLMVGGRTSAYVQQVQPLINKTAQAESQAKVKRAKSKKIKLEIPKLQKIPTRKSPRIAIKKKS